MMDNSGASQATGLAGAEAPEPPSRLGPTDGIPSADWPQAFGDEMMSVFRKEVPSGFSRWWAMWGSTVRFWRVKSLARTAYEDGFEVGARAAIRVIHEVRQSLITPPSR